MKRSILLGISGIFLLILPLVSYAQDPVDVSDEIMAVNDSFMEAIRSGDVKAVVGFYTEQARIMPPNAPVFEGRENITNMWGAMLEAGPMNLQFETISAEGFGTTAVEEGAYKVLSPDGQAVDHGKYIVIWKKVNGKWLLHQDIFNSSVASSGM